MSHQQDLFCDRPRGEQLAALRNLRLDTYVHNGRKVSPAIQKATLRAIDDHQGRGDCFASQSTLANEVGCGTTAIGLAIAALIAQDLITADRPHRMASNRHRVVWTSVFQRLRQSEGDTHSVSRDTPTGERDTHNVSPKPAQRVSSDTPSVSLSHAERVLIAPQTQIETPTNRPEDQNDQWAAVVKDLFSWGLKSAMASIVIAQSRGLSIEYVRELWIESGGDRSPERWEPGQLANWLTGTKPAPFDEDEAMRRSEARKSSQAKDAQRIRESVNADATASGVPQWVADGTTFRRLRDAGLVSHATDAEAEAARRMHEIDRTKRKPNSRVDKLGELLHAGK